MSNLRMFVGAMIVSVFATALVVSAEEGANESAVKINGAVSVTRNEVGEVTAVTITDASKDTAVVYTVKLEGKGADLATMDGQQVDVMGTVTKDGDKNVLTVKSIEIPKADAPAAGGE